MTIKLNEEDTKEMIDLFHSYEKAPVLSMTGKEEDSFQYQAQERLHQFQIRMGKKYGYDWSKHAINGDGEVIPI